MKKKIAIILSVVMVAALLAACSAGSYKNAGREYANDYYDAYPDEPYAPEPAQSENYEYAGTDESGFTEASGATTAKDFAEKMIYSASVQLETTKFEDTLASLETMIKAYGGFIESSYMTGQSYSSKWNNYEPRRSAQYIIRVPSSGFRSILDDFGTIGNVTESRNWAENITEQFYDSESRLNTLKVEEQRLLAMLEKADNVSDMIELESRLSDVRYSIESVTSRLRNWQNQVDYSTVTVSITEVKELTTVVEPQRTYWEEIGDGLASTFKEIWSFLKGAFKWFIIVLPVFLALGVVAVITVVIIKLATRSSRKKRKEAAEERSEDKKNNT
ncbi:MAG: DUF4349 domain-containing protein [Oscillospiraceae bacterium]|nr:DUF4349 domain-containing protein [Oscillospiraceae bacterium]